MACWAAVVFALVTSLAGCASAYDGQTCSHATFQAAPFMRRPAPLTAFDGLLAPLWRALGGDAAANASAPGLQAAVTSYMRNHAIAPIAGIGALFCLVLLSLLALLLWRFMRCLCVVCCQQEAYADASKVLFSRRLRLWKASMLLLGLAGAGVGAWGMYRLRGDLPAYVNAEVDALQAYPVHVAALVGGIADQAGSLAVPLDGVTDILVTQLNVSGLQADVVHIRAFLDAAPTPGQLKAVLESLEAELDSSLLPALADLQAVINSSSSSSPLQQLASHLAAMSAFNMSGMATTIDAYDAAVQGLLSKPPPAPAPGDAEYTALVAAHGAVMTDFAGWLAEVADARAAAAALESMRAPATNPFSIILSRWDALNTSAAGIVGGQLANLSATLATFNGLWHNNASLAFESALERMLYANASVFLLPPEVLSMAAVVNASIVQLNSMYEGNVSLLQLPGAMSDMGASLLAAPSGNGTATLLDELRGPEELLSNMGPSLAATLGGLDNLTSILTAVFKPAADAIGNAMPAFEGSANWPSFAAVLGLADAAVHATATVAAAAGGAGGFASSSAGGVLANAAALVNNIASSSRALDEQASSIKDVRATLASFDLSGLVAVLADADQVYQGFGSTPGQLLVPLQDLLTEVASLATTQLAAADGMIANVSSSIRMVADRIQQAAVTNIDQLQEQYLPANVTDKRTMTPVNVMAWARYGLLGAYGLVLFLLLLLFIVTLRNFPAGVCCVGFLLNLALILFGLLPVLYTLMLLVLRDTCANMDAVALKAAGVMSGNDSSTASLVARYYLLNGTLPDGDSGISALAASINPAWDIDAMKGRVNQTVADALGGITAHNLTLQPAVTVLLGNATATVQRIMGSVDELADALDYPAVSAVYRQAKAWLCCDLTDELFVQWACCVALLALAWVALQCALAVLRSLDGLSDHCCACSCYNAADYKSGPTADCQRRLPSLQLGGGSSSGEAVAVINIGGGIGSHKATALKYELQDATPLPPPLRVMTSSPSAPAVLGPLYPAVPHAAPFGGAPAAPASLSAQRAALLGVSGYPTITPGGHAAAGYMAAPSAPPAPTGSGRQSVGRM